MWKNLLITILISPLILLAGFGLMILWWKIKELFNRVISSIGEGIADNIDPIFESKRQPKDKSKYKNDIKWYNSFGMLAVIFLVLMIGGMVLAQKVSPLFVVIPCVLYFVYLVAFSNRGQGPW